MKKSGNDRLNHSVALGKIRRPVFGSRKVGEKQHLVIDSSCCHWKRTGICPKR